MSRHLLFVAVFALAAEGASAGTVPSGGDRLSCSVAIDAAERETKHPAQLVQTIAMVESGRLDPVDRQIRPWPWTINVMGVGHFYATKAEAIVAVETYRAGGAQSIDVGCMQINLQQHPSAFASLEEAFDPAANVAYGTRFLDLLYRRTGDWPRAIASYHSMTPAIGAPYWNRVQSNWALGSRYAAMPVSDAAVAQPRPAPVDPNMTPEFAARVREMAEDHRRNLAAAGVAAGPAERRPAGGRPSRQLVADGGAPGGGSATGSGRRIVAYLSR